MIVASLVLTCILTKRLTTFSVSLRDLSRIEVRELNETSLRVKLKQAAVCLR